MTRRRGLPAFDGLLRDVRFAARLLFKERLSTTAAVAMLSLGLGATVVMADMLDRLLLRPPTGIGSPDRVARIYTQTEGGHASALITNYTTVERLREGLTPEVEAIAPYMAERVGLGRGRDARALSIVACGDAYFDVLGLTARLGVLPSTGTGTGAAAGAVAGTGRAVTRDTAAAAGAGPVARAVTRNADTAVISHALWQQQFGGALDVVGRPLQVGTRVYTIVAVTPRGFAGIDTDPVDAWLPLASRAHDGGRNADWETSTAYFMFSVIARLRPGVDRARAEARATAVFAAGPAPTWEDGKDRSERVLFGELPPARAPGGSKDRRVVQWMTIVSVLVLLVACGNVGNVLLMRGLRRTSELALKAALGATRARLFRELLIEAGLLPIAAGFVALFFVVTGGAVARRFLLPPVVAAAAPLDGRLVALTALVCVAAGFLLGLVPALRLTRSDALTLARIGRLGRPSRLLDAFVSLQVALSVPLIVGAGLFGASLWHARQVNFGIQTSQVAVVTTNLVDIGEAAESHAAHRRMQERLARLPQVRAIAAVQQVPMRGGFAVPFSIPGMKPGPYTTPFMNGVDPSYFDVMHLHLLEGRAFVEAENRPQARPVVIVNEAMARTFWPGAPALGACMRVGVGDKPCAEIVGVVANSAMFANFALAQRVSPMFFVPIEQARDLTASRALLVQTVGDPQSMLSLLRREAQASGANMPYVDVWAFDDLFQPSLRPLRVGAAIFLGFGVLALIIASAGLAVVTAYGVARRTRELGIRLALGADPIGLVAFVLRRSLIAIGIGLAAGIPLAYIGGRWLTSLLFGITAGDMRVLTLAGLLLFIVGAVAAVLPARRAGRVDPAVALRAE